MSVLTITIQGVTDAGFVYVSDLPFATTPTNGWGPVERDLSNGEQLAGDGNVITLNGVTYTKGLGVHSNSAITFDLNGQYERFIADVGIDDEVGGLGSVTFEVWLDGSQIYDSGLMTGNTATRNVDVGVEGGNELRLVVADAGDGLSYDHADWANAKLLLATATNVPPVATADTNTINQGDVAPATGDLLANDTDFNGDLLSVASVDGQSDDTVDVIGAYGRLEWSAGGQYAYYLDNNHPIVRSLGVGQVATDEFSAAIDDGNGGTAMSVLTITIQGVTDAGFVYVSDLPFATTPTNGWGPVERDLSNGEQLAGDGNVITLNGVTYTKGLGVHSNSAITFDLNGQYERFIADVGIDDEVGGLGSVTFEVWLDGSQIYDSGLMTGNTATRNVDVGVEGGNELRLVVADAGDGLNYDHADWANAKLLKIEESDSPPALATSTSDLDLVYGLPWLEATPAKSSPESLVTNQVHDSGNLSSSTQATNAALVDLAIASNFRTNTATRLELTNLGVLESYNALTLRLATLETAFMRLFEEL